MDSDTITLDRHHHVACLSGGRCKIIRNDCHLIEAILIFSYSLRDLIRAGRFYKTCRAVGPQVWIDQLEKANCWSPVGADRAAQGRGASTSTGVSVVALGIRNPYRSSFDRQTGDFYFGDVGFNTAESIENTRK